MHNITYLITLVLINYFLQLEVQWGECKFFNLSEAFKDTKAKFFVISFTSDWLYPTQENKDIVIALNAIGANVGFVEIESDKGHDSFLLEVPDFLSALKNFLDQSYKE